MDWFDSVKSPKLKSAKKAGQSLSNSEEHWKKCGQCAEILQISKLKENSQVCPYCQHHFRMTARERIDLLVDEGSFISFADSLQTTDPLKFVDKKPYQERLEVAEEKTGLKNGTLCGIATINGQKMSLGVMDFRYMGGSMGVVTGEKMAQVFDVAYTEKIAAVIVSCSGGARMQEGILSLMQMAKTSGARQRLKNIGVPYISILTDPTTGGCAASFAMLGDLNIAEPKALIGFAGPRVIEQSIRQRLPKGFQRAEFLEEHGLLDRIVHRNKMREELSFYLQFFKK